MVVPMLIFLAFTAGSEGAEGWGIPVATDIAFALGILALVGSRVPLTLKVFLLAVAVFDDIGGILIIAVFYTDQIDAGWLAAAAGMLLVIVAMNRGGVRSIPAYVVVGAMFWLATFNSGVHATIAGVALGFLTPAASLYDSQRLPATIRGRLAALDSALALDDPHEREGQSSEAIREIEEYAREAMSPLDRIEHFLTPWAAFVVVPIFSLANAGIDLSNSGDEDIAVLLPEDSDASARRLRESIREQSGREVAVIVVNHQAFWQRGFGEFFLHEAGLDMVVWD